MVQRTRARTSYSGQGSRYYITSPPGTVVNNVSLYQRCIDNRAKGNGHDFDTFHLETEGGILNRQVAYPGLCFSNWQLDALRDPGDTVYNHLSHSGANPSLNVSAAEMLAKTNPSRPVVDLPIAIFELREIPKLLKIEGDSLLAKFGSANLSYQFGIKPLVNDLLGLLNFSDEVAKRQKELDALANSGLRRKRQLWSGSSVTSHAQFLQSVGYNVGNCGCAKTTAWNMWGFVEWFPIDKLALMKADRRALARDAVLGLTIDFSTAWNAIPWSWLIDWCSNVGDILVSKRNLVGASHGPIQIMRTAYTTGIWWPMSTTVQKLCSPCYWTLTTKDRRSFAGASLSVQLPILTWRQLSILASIGVTRRVPRNI